MSKIEVKDLLDAGVHFGHLTRKWNPNMAPYIYMERNGIHIINLYKSVAKIVEANEALSKIASSGRKILFVATKKQAKDIVSEKADNVNMPFITERWPGGMLTNFVTIRKAVKKMAAIDKMKADGTFNTLSKKEKLQVERLRAKLEKNLGSISDMTRLPGALFIVDIRREHIAVKEAQKLNIPIFAMVDTNADPRDVDYVIPANDDASKSIEKIMTLVTEAVDKGLKERQKDKADADAAATEGEVVAPSTSAKADKPTEVTTSDEEVEEAKVDEVAEEEVIAKKAASAKADKPAEVTAEEVVEEVVAEKVASAKADKPAKKKKAVKKEAAPAKADKLIEVKEKK
ncbi:MAG: 30S ribosomal protein S2 [Flavobacteriaceae bacterium]|nr:30S ribosomal protein S2 [Flavobacteriaceae bacterium]|tara:strand:- start:4179 stop:5210 length:1032 start_codon:yes stop_codon:yes gene_type:complete